MIGVAQGGLRGGDTDEILREFIDQTGVTFLVVRDSEGSYNVFRRSLIEPSISPFPLDVLLDRDRRLVSVRPEYDPGTLDAEVQLILDP